MCFRRQFLLKVRYLQLANAALAPATRSIAQLILVLVRFTSQLYTSLFLLFLFLLCQLHTLLLVRTLPMLLLTVLGAVASLLTTTARSELLLQLSRTSTA